MTATTLVSYTKAYSLLMGDAISNACVTNSLGPLETKTIQKTHSAVNSLGECCYARVDVGYHHYSRDSNQTKQAATF